MNISRRHIFALPLALAFLFAGCATIDERQRLSRVAGDVALIADAFTATLPALSQVAGIDPAAMTKIGGHIASLKQLAVALRDANASAVARPLVEQVVTNVQAVIGVLASVQAIPPKIRSILTAATILLPVIQIAVHISIPPAAPTSGMNVDDARTILDDASK